MATTFTSSATGNWSDATKWSGGTGSNYPGSDGSGDTVIIAGHTITLDSTAITTLATSSLVSITGNNAASVLAVANNATITLTGNPGLVYSSTNSNGFVQVTANKLTVTYGLGAGNVAVSATSSGHAIYLSSSGSVDVSNSGGVALKNSSDGRALVCTGSGTSTITGDILMASTATAATVRITGGTLNFTGVPEMTAGVYPGGTTVPIWTTGGTVNWTGSVTINSGVYAVIMVAGGTLVLNSLSCALSGQVLIGYVSGTLTIGTGRMNLQTATAQCAVLGTANTNLIVGASIPSAADTRYGVTRGWPSGSTDATTGGGVAGGNGLLEIPNSGTPTGTQDETSDACVVSGKKYGSPQRTGSATAGGSTPVPNFGGLVQRRA